MNVVAVDHPLVRGPLVVRQVGHRLLVEEPLGADGLHDLGVLAVGEPAGDERPGEHGVGLVEHLAGVAERDQR